MLIKINVTNRKATLLDSPVLVCGNSTDQVEFTFDSEWSQYTAKTARFVYVRDGEVKYQDVPFTGNTANIPQMVNITEVRIGVFAEDLVTTTPAVVPCEKSIKCSTGEPEAPTADVYGEIMRLFNETYIDPSLTVVDQSYNPDSTNPQSGKAVAEALECVVDTTKGGNLFDKTSEDITKQACFSNTLADGNPVVVPYLNEDGTVKEAASKYKFITHYIPIEQGKTYTASWDSKFYGTTTRIFLYDSDFNFIKILYSTAPETQTTETYTTFTVNAENAAYMRFNNTLAVIDNVMVVEGDTYPEEYLVYGKSFHTPRVDQSYNPDSTNPQSGKAVAEATADALAGAVKSALRGKIISFNGDSICAGAGASGGYGKIIAERCGMIYENIGVSGGTVMYSGADRHCISRTVANMRADADYIILEGGVNDLYSDRPLGSLSNGYNAELDDTTFYGAFENMLKQALARFPGKKIGYIAVHKMGNYFDACSENDNAYHAAIKCCKKWGIPVCDLNVSCPPFAKLKANADTAFLADLYTAESDGWHPNEQGYLKYYCDPIERWLETL